MSKITAMYIRLSMEDEDVSLNQKEESNSVSSQRELLEAFIGFSVSHRSFFCFANRIENLFMIQ